VGVQRSLWFLSPLRGYTRLSGGRHLHEAIAFPRAVLSLAASLFPLASVLLVRTPRNAAATTALPIPPKTSLNATHLPYAPRTSLHDIPRLLYALYAHECHVKITAQTPVQSIQSQPRRSTGTLTPPPFPLRLPTAISRGNPKVQKVTLRGFQDDHQFPPPLQPFSRSSVLCIPIPDSPNPP